MALMHGHLANIYWDADNTDILLSNGTAWSLSTTHEAVETSIMQNQWKDFVTGFQDWTATVDALLPSGGIDIALGGDDGMGDDTAYLELYLVFDTGIYRMLHGLAICNGISSSTDAQGNITVSYTFQGDGQLSWFSGATRKTYV